MNIKERILFEDNHLLIVNKEAKELVQGDKTGDPTLADHLKAYIKVKYKKPGEVYLGIVHRIDRPTSGVVVFTKTSKALARLNAQFANREVKKSYWALVEGHVADDKARLEHMLLRDGNRNKSFVSMTPQAKKAVLSYEVMHRVDKYSLLAVSLETGRHHQIRCQLAKIGHPVQGDVKYGARRGNKDNSIGLHAQSIAFNHPTLKDPVSLSASPPKQGIWHIAPPNMKDLKKTLHD